MSGAGGNIEVYGPGSRIPARVVFCEVCGEEKIADMTLEIGLNQSVDYLAAWGCPLQDGWPVVVCPSCRPLYEKFLVEKRAHKEEEERAWERISTEAWEKQEAWARDHPAPRKPGRSDAA